VVPEAGLEPAYVSILDFESIVYNFLLILKSYQNLSKYRIYSALKNLFIFFFLHLFLLKNKFCSKIVVKKLGNKYA